MTSVEPTHIEDSLEPSSFSYANSYFSETQAGSSSWCSINPTNNWLHMEQESRLGLQLFSYANSSFSEMHIENNSPQPYPSTTTSAEPTNDWPQTENSSMLKPQSFTYRLAFFSWTCGENSDFCLSQYWENLYFVWNSIKISGANLLTQSSELKKLWLNQYLRQKKYENIHIRLLYHRSLSIDGWLNYYYYASIKVYLALGYDTYLTKSGFN